MNKLDVLAGQIEKLRVDAIFSDDFDGRQLQGGEFDFLQAMAFLSLAYLSLRKASPAYAEDRDAPNT